MSQQNDFQEPEQQQKKSGNIVWNLLKKFVEFAGSIPIKVALITAVMCIALLFAPLLIQFAVGGILYTGGLIASGILMTALVRRGLKKRSYHGVFAKLDAITYRFLPDENVALVLVFLIPFVLLFLLIGVMPLVITLLSGTLKWMIVLVLLIMIVSIAYHMDKHINKPVSNSDTYTGYRPTDPTVDPYRAESYDRGYGGGNDKNQN